MATRNVSEIGEACTDLLGLLVLALEHHAVRPLADDAQNFESLH